MKCVLQMPVPVETAAARNQAREPAAARIRERSRRLNVVTLARAATRTARASNPGECSWVRQA